MNSSARIVSAFIATVLTVSGGTYIARVLTDDDIANAAPRDEVVRRKGSTASLRAVCVTLLAAPDGGKPAIEIRATGSFTEATELLDGGVAEVKVNKTPGVCTVPSSGATGAAALELLEHGGLSCFRRNLNLEK